MSSVSLLPSSSSDARTVERTRRRVRTAALIDRARGAIDDDRDALLNQVVIENRGVAEAVAAHFRDRGVPLEDLHQTAYEGLLKAVRRFDPDASDDLLTFAVPTIRGEIQRYFRDHGWSVRPPRRVQRLRGEIRVVTEDLRNELGREARPQEVVARLGIDRAAYAEAMRADGAQHATSLDQPTAADSTTVLGDLLTADPSAEPNEDRVVVAGLLRTLTERERLIVRLRFVDDLTQTEIGERVGVTQMQVSRLLSGILSRLRDELER